ncbi:hypothetical protein [Kangiella geojedonensis]|uniref:hypothetical protein n=1 Tax=Kangiella geojedonensis TaxID=914150 RepID=UPI0006272FCA|nr:hypothetical protein [Kangiella geojedonensis]
MILVTVKGEKVRLGLLGSAGLAVMLTGCSMGHDELEKLCKEDAGTVINKQVEAEGLYYESCNGLCWLNMISYGFEYVEMNNTQENHRYLPENGFWRIYFNISGSLL